MLLTALMTAMSALPTFATYTLKIDGESIDTSEWDGNFKPDAELFEGKVQQSEDIWQPGQGQKHAWVAKNVELDIQGDSTVRMLMAETQGEKSKFREPFFLCGPDNHITVGKGCTLSLVDQWSGLAGGFYGQDTCLTLDLSGSLISEYAVPSGGEYATAFIADGQKCTVNINIHDGGVFNGPVKNPYGGSRPNGIQSVVTAGGVLETNVTVEDGGTINGYELALGCVLPKQYTPLDSTPGGKAYTYLTLRGGKYEEDGMIGKAGTENGETHTEIVIKDGGSVGGLLVYDIEGEIITQQNNGAKIAQALGDNTKTELLLSVAGEGSTYHGGYWGEISTVTAGKGSVTQTAYIEVKDHAEFTVGSCNYLGTHIGKASESAQGTQWDLKLGIFVQDATFRLESGALFYVGTPTEKADYLNQVGTFTDYTFLEMHGDSSLDFSGAEFKDDTDKLEFDKKLDFTSNQKVGIWGTVLVGGGNIVLSESDPDGTRTFRKGVIIDTDTDYHGEINLGGLDAGKITSEYTYRTWNGEGFTFSEGEKRTGFRINGADTRVTGLKEGSTLTLKGTDNTITVGDTGIGVGDKAGQWIIEFNNNSGNVTLEPDGKLTLNFAGTKPMEGVTDEKGNVDFYVYLTNGDLTIEEKDIQMATGWDFSVEHIDPETGKLHITGNISNVWDAEVEDKEDVGRQDVTIGELSVYDKVVVDEETHVDATGGGTIKQLQGDKDLNFTGTGDVNLENQTTPASFGSPQTSGDTIFSGNISAEAGVNLKKTGDSTLAVEGNLKTEGNFSVEEGTIKLGTAEKESESSIGGELKLGDSANGKSGNLEVYGRLTLSGGVAEGSQGTFGGVGTVLLDGEDTTFGEGVKLDGDLTFELGEHAVKADFGAHDVTVQDLTGAKDVTAKSVDLIGEGNFTGTITGDVSVRGTYNLSGANVRGNLDVGGAGETGTTPTEVVLDEAPQHLTVDGDVILRKEATTRIRLNFGDAEEWSGTQHDAVVLETAKNIIVEKGTTVEIENLSDVVASNMKKGEKEVILMDAKHVYTSEEHYNEGQDQLKDTESVGTEHESGARVKLDHTLNWLFKDAHLVFYNGKEASEQEIMLTAADDDDTETQPHDSYIAAVFDVRTADDLARVAGSHNAVAASRLLWHYTNDKTPDALDPTVHGVVDYLGDIIDINPKETRKVLAAISGSTLTSLSAAQNAEHRWQMGRVRDHALMAGNLRCAEYNPDATRVGACRTTQVWAEGTSFYSEQHTRGDESGYRLNSWGGALGMDVQMRSNWSVGLALAANYGDLEANAADHAKGDFDSYYMSAWSQAKNGRWGNTLVATFGISEASLNRTVNAAGASYTAKSSPSGSSLGAMWELTYDLYPVKDNHRQVLQPLFSVAVSHTSMDAFSETGAGGLGLSADKQTRDTVTLGLGARWMAAIETGKAANRTIGTELRMNVAQDMGDRRSTADVALLADPTYTQTVRGARAGTTAFQFGAGVNIPVTRYSQLYLNAGGDLRTHAATWNGALGVRIGF